ncbi:substrate-binding periplasmic protein [Crenobacter cavernae]|uniref:Solute-binding protein family 3/N-terminal domain-containing protein n=1 Tax=Crenobacter cavernae TaxID=2290923 RepID=A0A345Y4E0_9NEIS|nr:hypothetical protein [Crenobacter cavernae]AXK38792.1 hypothetical protein DWG20_04725 [Crenobacter cavernae]
MWRSVAVLCASVFLAAWSMTASAAPPLRITCFDVGPLDAAAQPRLRAAYAKIGRSVEFVVMPGARALQATVNGAADGELLRVAGLENIHPELRRVPVPLIESRTTAYARRGEAPDLSSGWAALRRYRFAYTHGTRIVEEHAGDLPGGFAVESVRQAFSMLMARRVDLVIAERGNAKMHLRRMRLDADVKAVRPALQVTPLYHYLNRRHADLALGLAEALRHP